MSETQKDFRDSVKAVSLFGSIQLFVILINIAKSKLIAILIGPTGLGIWGLFQSTINILRSSTSFGLEVSSVRNVAEANGNGDIESVSEIDTILKYLVWGTGLLGGGICLCLSPWLSEWTFGNKNYTLSFVYLSISLLFMQLTVRHNVLMQGLRKYKYLAFANFIGNLCSLIISVPLYFYWGINAIVPIFILSSLSVWVISIYYSSKINIKKKVTVSSKEEVISRGKALLSLGFFISLQSILATLATYIVRVYIHNMGSIEDVGLYTAGFAIINGYVELIFTALAKEYYPRLSEIINDPQNVSRIICNQIELVLLLLAPIITFFVLCSNQIIVILYSDEFLSITSMLYWAIFAVYFRGLSYPLAYYLLAKGDVRCYFFNELLAIVISLTANIVCYHFLGLIGLGISCVILYVCYFLQSLFLVSWKYNVKIRINNFIGFLIHFLILILMLLIVVLLNGIEKYMIGLFLLILSIYITFHLLDKRIGIKMYLKNKMR